MKPAAPSDALRLALRLALRRQAAARRRCQRCNIGMALKCIPGSPENRAGLALARADDDVERLRAKGGNPKLPTGNKALPVEPTLAILGRWTARDGAAVLATYLDRRGRHQTPDEREHLAQVAARAAACVLRGEAMDRAKSQANAERIKKPRAFTDADVEGER